MLTKEKNQLLTQVGPGTPGGDMLRRHWHPFAAVDELDQEPIKAVRLLGEDLVVYKDLSGNYGLTERQCAHRNADLSYGMVEEHGIRCNYHGWCYDASGQCTEQPFEDVIEPTGRMRKKVRLTAYQVQAKAGLLWAYMGPMPAPLLPDWELLSFNNGFAQIVFADVPCNWVQAQENSIDPVHFEWMHSNWSKRQRGETGNYAPRHVKLEFEEFEHGFVYKRVREDTDEAHNLWTVGRVCLWPNGFFLGDHFEWRVPVDDENTLSVTWAFLRVPKESEPFEQASIPSWRGPVVDPVTGKWISSHVINQDIIAWVGQGKITDRSRENLGASDRGVAMIRRQLFADMEEVRSGRDPKGVIRDPARNVRIPLPNSSRDLLRDGLPLSAYLKHPVWGKHLTHFPFHFGQPEHVKRMVAEAVGIQPDDAPVVAVNV
jgi:5,5'-dehydrodivanillate O-demethylase